MCLNTASPILIHLNKCFHKYKYLPSSSPKLTNSMLQDIASAGRRLEYVYSKSRADYKTFQVLLMGKRSKILQKGSHHSLRIHFTHYIFFYINKGESHLCAVLVHPTSKLPYCILKTHIFYCQESQNSFFRCGLETQAVQNYTF